MWNTSNINIKTYRHILGKQGLKSPRRQNQNTYSEFLIERHANLRRERHASASGTITPRVAARRRREAPDAARVRVGVAAVVEAPDDEVPGDAGPDLLAPRSRLDTI